MWLADQNSLLISKDQVFKYSFENRVADRPIVPRIPTPKKISCVLASKKAEAWKNV